MMFKTIKSYLPIVILVIALAACQNNSTDPEFNYSKINSTSPDSSAALITGDSVIVPQQQPSVVTTPAQQPTAAKTATGLNPEHGKPGHRCDISVGAPLNSKPTTVTSTPTPTPTPPAQITSSAPKTATAAGMNPPHGQPGHKCEIAVGAPLNSKPVSPLVADTSKK